MTPIFTTAELAHQLIWGRFTCKWTGKRFHDYGLFEQYCEQIVSFTQKNSEAIVLWISRDKDLSGDRLRDHIERSLNRYNIIIQGLEQFATLRDIDAQRRRRNRLFRRSIVRTPISVQLVPKLGKGFESVAIARVSDGLKS